MVAEGDEAHAREVTKCRHLCRCADVSSRVIADATDLESVARWRRYEMAEAVRRIKAVRDFTARMLYSTR